MPWHQDNAYLHESCWIAHQLTLWLPFINTNVDNGCMQVVRGGHLTGLTAPHTGCVGDTWYVECSRRAMTDVLKVDLREDIVDCEVPVGSVLLLNNLTPHQSLPNLTDDVRWSFDLRYQRTDQPNGFQGAKENVEMVRAHDTHFKMSWEGWADYNRQKQRDNVHVDKRTVHEVDVFDTVISGQWMNQWPITHENKHTEPRDKTLDVGGTGYQKS